MKKYVFLTLTVLFVLLTSSLKAQQWMLAPGLVETNAEGAPIIVYENKIVIFSVGSGVTWNGVTNNIPVLVYDKVTGKTYKIKGDPAEPVTIHHLIQGEDHRTWYLVPKVQQTGHFYKIVIGDDIAVTRIESPYSIENICYFGGPNKKVVAVPKPPAGQSIIRKVCTFEHETYVKSVEISDSFYTGGGMLAEFQGKLVMGAGNTKSDAYIGLGMTDPETGEFTRLDKDIKVQGIQQGGEFTVKDGKLLYGCQPGSLAWKGGLFEYQPTTDDWRLIDTNTGMPVYDPTFNIWKVYLPEGGAYYGQKASKKGWYQVNDTVITYIEEDYRVSEPIPQVYFQKIHQLYGFNTLIDKVFDVQGTTFGTGPGIIAIWGKPNSIQVIAKKQELGCYPNPATDVINVTGAEFLTPVKFTLNDMTGREVATGETTGTIENIGHLVPGIYTIVVYHSSGITFTARFQKN